MTVACERRALGPPRRCLLLANALLLALAAVALSPPARAQGAAAASQPEGEGSPPAERREGPAPAAPAGAPAPAPPAAAVPALAATIPFEQEPLAKELAAVEAALAEASEARLKERLTHERNVLAAALETIRLRAALAAQQQGVEGRLQAAKDEAARLAEEAKKPLEVPSPFTEEHLQQAREQEKAAAARLEAAEAALKAAEQAPDRLRAELKTFEEALQQLEAGKKDLVKREAEVQDAEEKRALRRRLAIREVNIQHHNQRIAYLRESLEALQKELPVLRLERDNAARRLERARERLKLFLEAEEKRLAAERARAEEEARRLEILKREGRPYEQLLHEAEALINAEVIRNQELKALENRWSQQLQALRGPVEQNRREAEALRERLEAPGGTEARTALLLDQLREVLRQAQERYEAELAPAAAEARRTAFELRAELDQLDEQRREHRETVERLRARAQEHFAELIKRYPGFYTERQWQLEERKWSRLEEQLIELYTEREAILRRAPVQLIVADELGREEQERLARLGALVRRRAFWLREQPIIESARLAPALAVLERAVARAEEAVREPERLAVAAWSWLAPWRLGQLALCAAAALVLVLAYRRERRLLARLASGEVGQPIPLGLRCGRAGLRFVEALLPGMHAAALAALVHLVFGGPWSLTALLLAAVLAGGMGAAALLRAVLRPFEAPWRLVPCADDLAALLYRLGNRLIAVTALYAGLMACTPLLGAEAAAALRPALGLVYRSLVTLLLLLAAASPALTRRLLRLISPAMAERLRKLLFPLGLFVGATVVSIFVLEAIGYRNAARSVTRSLLVSLGVVIGGLVLDRVLYRMVLARIFPEGMEDKDEAAEGGAAAAAAEDPEAQQAAVRRRFLRELAGTITDTVVILVIVTGILLAFDVERATIDRVFAYEIVPGEESGLGAVRVRDALAALLILVITYVIYRYFRGFVAHFVLPRFGLSRGARFAITSVAGYIIAGAGVLLALGRVNIHLGDLQWFLAAAGVGIGFGLQEILSNFVSGLILLIERPIEVGDIVTVGGNLEGEIKRITIRATTVQTRDNVAVIVPNKDFITSSVINWSHGDPKVRVRVPVGVAYGSNVQLVRETLLEVASNYGRIMKRPAPEVSFKGFGASSLDFELAVWLATPDPSMRRRVVSDLCAAIDAAFRRAQIEIAFPQIDVHIRKGEPLQLAFAGAAADGGESASAASREEGPAARGDDAERRREEERIQRSIARQKAKRSRELRAPSAE
ncbi:MAG: hypothetical protein KatS3mg102_1763 [Planctomycetota bacterium]|nr:MAG: hypothetical protein KatS3mg102_1763 [Planctomycetota bacterium]